jgi:hypothetical protein
MISTFAQMEDGTFFGMSDTQERLARKAGLRTIKLDSGSWGWVSGAGEDFGYSEESEAWAAGLLEIEHENRS